MIGWPILLMAAQAASAPAPQVFTSAPATRATIDAGTLELRAGHRAVGEHLGALYAQAYDQALSFVSPNVENVISDLRGHMNFPRGRQIAKASYLSMTQQGKHPLKAIFCTPDVAEGQDVTRCELRFGKGKKVRRFTMRYFVENNEIVKIYSWAVNGGKLMPDG